MLLATRPATQPALPPLTPPPGPRPRPSPRSAAEHGLQLCRQLGLPADDDMVAGFEAVQTELQAMIEGEKKEQKAAEKAGKGKQ